MTKIEPYKTISEAISSLDNGGRFYNLFTKADDGVISAPELGKAGGLFNDKQRIMLFFELSISQLNENEKSLVISKLEKDLQEEYLMYKPVTLSPYQANTSKSLESNTIITGTPKRIESKSQFSGFIMVPIMAGEVTTNTMIPLYDVYDIYELKDETSGEHCIIAHSKHIDKLPEQKINVAGVMKESSSDGVNANNAKRYLEVIYYTETN